MTDVRHVGRSRKELTFYEGDLKRTKIIIVTEDGVEVDILVKGNQIHLSAYGKALSVEPRAANQIRVGFIDPYDRDD